MPWIVDNDHDWLHALGGTPGGRAASAGKRDEFGAQVWMQAVEEPRGDVSAFVGREAEAAVVSDRDAHSTAHEIPAAVRPSPPVALL